jgi:dynein intermediate chain 1, axonemal
VEDTPKELNFFSISSDGHVASWVMSKNELKMEPVMQLKLVSNPGAGLLPGSGGGSVSASAVGAREDPEEVNLSGLAGGCCFDFNKHNDHLFIVGTEEGKIHKCSKAYSGQYLETYAGHHMAVYTLKWNPYHQRVFISCSADWTVKIWEHGSPLPVLSFDLGCAVGDVAWAPYSSTVFAAVTSDGKVHYSILSFYMYSHTVLYTMYYVLCTLCFSLLWYIRCMSLTYPRINTSHCVNRK